MKTRVKIQNLLLALGLAAVAATQTPNSFADDKSAAGSNERGRARTATEGFDFVIDQGEILQSDGHGRTPAALRFVVEALRKRYDQANIVCSPELVDIIIPDLKLRAHELPEMLEAIRAASGGKFEWAGPGAPGAVAPPAVDPATGLPIPSGIPASMDPNNGLYVLRAPEQGTGNERVVEAFNIGPFLDRKISEARSRQQSKLNRDEIEHFSREISAEEVQELQEEIVSTVAKFKQTDENTVKATLKFQYHSGANLLVAVGPRNDVEVVRKMMNALMTDPNGVRVDGIRADLTEPVREEPQPVSVEAIPVKSAKMDSAYAAAMSLLTDKRSKVVLSDARSKTLIVQATKAEVIALRAAIQQLDQAAKPYIGDNPVAR